MNGKDILLISNRSEIAVEIRQLLLERKINVEMQSSETSLYSPLRDSNVEMVVVDFHHLNIQGLNHLRVIRSTFDGLFILLSSPEDEQSALLALQLGADLCLSTKSSALLIAENVHAIYRRLTRSRVIEYRFGDLRIDAGKRDAFLAERPVNLSTVEFELLWLLTQKAGQAVSREDIHWHLYNSPYNGYDRSIDLYISRIRKKIDDIPSAPIYLKTVQGIGYQFTSPYDQR